MTSYYYVNINDAYSTTGSGSKSNPYQWSQFIDKVDGSLTKDSIFFLKGTRTLSSATTIEINSTEIISFRMTTWTTTPWKLDVTGNLDFSFGNVNDNEDYKCPENIYIEGGIINLSGNLYFNNLSNNTGNDIQLDNMWIEES